MRKSFGIALVIWLAVGVAISGYCFIDPPKVWVSSNTKRGVDEYYQFSILITLVGAILIGGLGLVLGKRI